MVECNKYDMQRAEQNVVSMVKKVESGKKGKEKAFEVEISQSYRPRMDAKAEICNKME